MAMKLQIFEILDKLKEFTGKGSNSEKAAWLQKNDSPTLRLLLRHAFDPNIAYDLPEGEPPYKINDAPVGLTESSLFAETRKLEYLWLTPSTSALQDFTETQREKLAEGETEREKRAATHAAAVAAVKDADAEIVAAREAIVAAKTRYDKALADAGLARAAAQDATIKLRTINDYMVRLTNHLNNTNNVLMQREGTVPTPPSIPKHKRQEMFINLLESIPAGDAKVMLAVKNKTLTKLYPITKDVVDKAFPNLVK